MGVIFRKGFLRGSYADQKIYLHIWTGNSKGMTTEFERIRIVLKLKERDDPLIEVVAKKVVSLASQVTHDPKEIERLVIADTKRT